MEKEYSWRHSVAALLERMQHSMAYSLNPLDLRPSFAHLYGSLESTLWMILFVLCWNDFRVVDAVTGVTALQPCAAEEAEQRDKDFISLKHTRTLAI